MSTQPPSDRAVGPITPWFDPWHGRNPVFLHDLRMLRRPYSFALGLREEGVPRRPIGRLVSRSLTLLAILAVNLVAIALAVRIDPLAVVALWFGTNFLYEWAFMVPLTGYEGVRHSATALCREREQRTWEMLRTTPLTYNQIVLGKFLAALEAIPAGTLITFVATAPALQAVTGAALLTFTPDGADPRNWLWLAGKVCASLCFLTAALAGAGAIGIGVSSLVRDTSSAVGLSWALVAGTHFAVPLAFVFYALPRVQAGAVYAVPVAALMQDPSLLIPALVATLVYGLLTVALLRLAVWRTEHAA